VCFYEINYFSNDKTITPLLGWSLLPSFFVKNYFRPYGCKEVLTKKGEQNRRPKFDELIISSLLSNE